MVGAEAITLNSETNMVKVKEHLYGKGHAHCGSFYAQTGPSPAIALRIDD